MSLQIAAMIVGLLLVSGASLWGLNALHQDYSLAAAGYEELRHLYEDVGSRFAVAEALISSPTPDRGDAASQLDLAIQRFELHERRHNPTGPILPDEPQRNALRQRMRAALAQLQSGAPGKIDPEVLAADTSVINDVLAQVRGMSLTIRKAIDERQKAAEQKRTVMLAVTGVICAAVIVGAVLLGVFQYRSVMTPLRRLGGGVRKIAAGQFTQRLEERGGQEFAALAHDFNRMAGELDDFYHRLEQKVAEKSKELIRSERLASVGYLAAGVAHEINNPLGIIAGYAEYSLSQLRQQPRGNGEGDVEKSLQVICDEAFRCKDITAKLLSLARAGEENRKPVDVGAVAHEVAAAVGGLPEFRDRKLVVIADPRQDLHVTALEAEMKQVVLNLTINALEAAPPQKGEVRIEVSRRDATVELQVRDNGRGMSKETLERVFEPFYTEKRGHRGPGTGLGLSITHAIVTDHGGTIRAESEGPDRGSRFVVELPAATRTEAAA